MIAAADLLNPIAGANPCGEDLRYSPVFDAIREARRRDDGGPQGEWEKERKNADFAAVERLASDALMYRTKDLQIAVWLAEALIWQHRLGGLVVALEFLSGLIDTFWDNLYPSLVNADIEDRAVPLDWFGSYFEPAKGSSPILAVVSAPLTANGLNWTHFLDARAEKSVYTTPQQCDTAVEATPKQFYKDLANEIATSLTGLAKLNTVCTERFGKAAPSFTELATKLEEIQNKVTSILKKKLQREPDAAPVPSESAGAVVAGTGQAAAVAMQREAEPSLAAAAPSTRESALAAIVAGIRFWRHAEPSNPAPYLMARAIRWGELRALKEIGTAWTAPSSDLRRRLRTLSAASAWAELLDETETAVVLEAGGCWLDLHRYAVKACEQLGYDAAARAIKSELRALLTDYPQLPSMTLADDTGTANPETAVWLAKELKKD
jgi:type VI secretion system protein ImpA